MVPLDQQVDQTAHNLRKSNNQDPLDRAKKQSPQADPQENQNEDLIQNQDLFLDFEYENAIVFHYH